MEYSTRSNVLISGANLDNFGAVVYYAPTLEDAISVGNVRGFEFSELVASGASVADVIKNASNRPGMDVPKIVTALRSEESNMMLLTDGETFTLLTSRNLIERTKGITPIVYWEMDDVSGVGIFAYRGGNYNDDRYNYGVNLPNFKECLEWLFEDHENITYEMAYERTLTLDSDVVVAYIDGEYYITWLEI